MAATEITRAIEDLDALTRRLRRDCPWDREQDERSIVPHTIEEAYELADAAIRRDDAKLLDELGDVLFQVCFLSLLLEERGAGDLAQVAEHCRQKLIGRHPHVFGEVRADDAAQVMRNWEGIKAGEPGREQGVFGEVPESLPALLYARKIQHRAASAGLHHPEAPPGSDPSPAPGAMGAARAGGDEPSAREARDAGRGELRRDEECFRDIGDRLFALVDEARRLHVDPELALRAAAQRFREKIGVR